MLVRQAITFTYQGRSTGPYTELGAALANALLRDYAAALGIASCESGTNYRDLDYGRVCGYSMEWTVPDTAFDSLSENASFDFTPAIGKFRPVLRDEVLSDREIVVRLEDLASKASGHLVRD